MPRNSAIGILLGVMAGLANGVFLLPMRYTRKWAWENTWIIFTVLSTGLLPWIAALVAVPDFISIVRKAPFRLMLPGLAAGGIWGIAQVMYGLGVGIMGIAVGSAVISCISTICGALGPMLVYAPNRLFSSTSLVLLVGIVLIAWGIYQYAEAGTRKERETAGKEASSQIVTGSFRTGLVFCLATGVLGTAFIYGGRSSVALINAARAAGAAPDLAFYAAYAITFNAGMIPGLLFSVYKLYTRRTVSKFITSGSFWWNLALSVSMALLWYSGILMYGMSSEKMGVLGPSIAFVFFAGGTILFANFFGWLAGEWKGASPRTVRDFVLGMVLLVLAIVIVALGANRPV